MKKILIVLVILLLWTPFVEARGGGGHYGRSYGSYSKEYSGNSGSHSVKGYVRKDGTYVQPHQQTNPNDSKYDNWSTKGNENPYTGKKGTVDPDKIP